MKKIEIQCQFCGHPQTIDEILLGEEIPCLSCYKFFKAGGKPIVKAKPGKTTQKFANSENFETFDSCDLPMVLARVFKDEMAEMPAIKGYPGDGAI